MNIKRNYCPECGREIKQEFPPGSFYVCFNCSSVLYRQSNVFIKPSIGTIIRQPEQVLQLIQVQIFNVLNQQRKNALDQAEKELSEKLYYRGYFRRRVYERKKGR